MDTTATWTRALVALGVSLATMMPAPALAAPSGAAPTPVKLGSDLAPSPFMAGLMSGLGPLSVLAGAGLVYSIGLRDAAPMVVIFTAPLALGAGQVYAGDPMRGLAVGAGSYAAVAGGAGAGYGLYALGKAASWSETNAIALWVLTGATVVIGYYGWAVNDAAKTADRAATVAQ